MIRLAAYALRSWNSCFSLPPGAVRARDLRTAYLLACAYRLTSLPETRVALLAQLSSLGGRPILADRLTQVVPLLAFFIVTAQEDGEEYGAETER